MINKITEKIFSKKEDELLHHPLSLFEKERRLFKKSFYFKGNNKKAVLLIHGWSTTPYEVRRLGVFLNQKGYTVYAPMLSGHGTKSKDLEDVKWEEWEKDAERAYEKLSKKYKKIYVAGTSMGSNLSIVLAQKYPAIAGIVLMATPYRIKFEEVVTLAGRAMSKIKKYRKKIYPPTFGSSSTITRLISYQKYPIASALEAGKLIKYSRKQLRKVSQPCLLLQSTHDHIVSKGSMDRIFFKIGSSKKEKKYVHRAYHTFISDIKNEHVFEDILNFLEEN